MKVYAVRNRHTGEYAPKYASTRFYVRKGDATKRKNGLNTWPKKTDDWEVVSSELNWEIEE